jgi:hypothetical protein
MSSDAQGISPIGFINANDLVHFQGFRNDIGRFRAWCGGAVENLHSINSLTRCSTNTLTHKIYGQHMSTHFVAYTSQTSRSKVKQHVVEHRPASESLYLDGTVAGLIQSHLKDGRYVSSFRQSRSHHQELRRQDIRGMHLQHLQVRCDIACSI